MIESCAECGQLAAVVELFLKASFKLTKIVAS